MLKKQSNRLRAAVGGKWLGYAPPYLALLPLWFLASILSNPLTEGWPALWPTIVANLGAFVPCTAVFFIFRVTLWRHRETRSISIWIVVLSGIALGVIKAITTALLMNLFVGTEPTDLLGRVFSSAALAVAVVIVVPITFSQLALYRQEREQLIAELVRRNFSEPGQKENAPQTVSLPLSRRTRKIAESLEDFVTRSRERLDAARKKPFLLPQILEDIREKDARALSHQIWQRESERIPDFTVSNLVAVSLSRLNFVIFPVLLIFALVAGPVELFTYGVHFGLIAVIVQAMIIAAVLSLARLLPQRDARWGWQVFIGALVVMTAGIAIVTPFIAKQLTIGQNIQQAISTFLLLGCAVFSSSVVNMAQRTIKQVHEDINVLTPDLGIEAISRAGSARLNLELAQLLHSQVQNVLLSRSIQLQETLHTASLDPAVQDKILMKTVEELDSYLNHLLENKDSTKELPESIEQVCAAWAGVVAVNVIGDLKHTNTHTSESALISTIVAEAISNSVKHGLAKAATLTVECENSPHCTAINIRLDDDGVGVRQGAPGLGSMYLDSIPHATWSLGTSQRLGGAFLSVRLSL